MHQSSGLVTFDSAHAKICALCDHFDARRDEIMSPEYREATARAEFITPFFEALGWDVNNTAHRTIYEKDCVLEKAEAHGGTQRSADYAFRRPGTHLTAFFVEAKKSSIDIRHHNECYQAVLYGWNASTPLVVLTDFEQFLILDARSRPDKQNAASHILRENGSYSYRDYRDPEKFTEIWGLFSRQAVADGSIDKAAAALPRLSGRLRRDELFPRGTRAVDDDFLAQMERWRETLAKSLKRTNQNLNGEELTSITQRVLDRLIFLRFLEDRLIERDVTFEQIGRSGSAWRDFERVSDRLDARYNGIIYKHDRDGADNPSLYVDDAAFASVVENLEPRNSDYKFATIPLTILGSIYERFLGKVIIAKPKTAEVVWKPENLKQHGVYYTPDYVVRYIVNETVGHCIAKKTPQQIADMRFADIACGSGSFLVEVFDKLIRHQLRWYVDNGTAKWEKRGVLRRRETDGDYVLTLAEKRGILLNNIYGVDIDQQAVEVTQLSLYLRLLEDESFPSTQLLFDIEHRALLPDLRDNVICGNALIETDIADLFGLSPEEEAKIRPLDIRYAFKNIKPDKDGAIFDAVIGNPPYVRMEVLKPIKEYLGQRYECQAERADLYAYFIERAHKLLKRGGRFSYIVSNKFLRAKYGARLRDFLTLRHSVQEIAGLPVFPNATVRTIVLSTKQGLNGSTVMYYPPGTLSQFRKLTSGQVALDDYKNSLRVREVKIGGGPATWLLTSISASKLLERIKASSRPLGEAIEGPVGYGIKTGFEGAFVISPAQRREILQRDAESRHLIKPYILGRQIRRYFHETADRFVIYTPKGTDINRYPGIKKHLERFRNQLARRAAKQKWFELQQSQLVYEPWFKQPKIIYPDIAPEPRFAFDEQGLYGATTTFFIGSTDKALLGLLNSSFSNFYFTQITAALESAHESYLRFKTQYVVQFPVPELPIIQRNTLVKLVDKMLAAKKTKAKAEGVRREHWTRQCEALDRQIDALVYELYGLTDEEIALVEQAR